MAETKKTRAEDNKAPKLQTQTEGQPPQDVVPNANDPKGFKQYIAWSIAWYLFPVGSAINPEQDISNNVNSNADNMSTLINQVYAPTLAKHYGLTWTNIDVADIKRWNKVSDLEKAVIDHLKAAGQ